MLLEFSHILAFSALFVSSLFDVFSEKGDVPSIFMLAAVLGGVVLHGIYSFSIGSFTPFIWMLGVGLFFSLYGWMAYWLGMWGGADALAMTVLGFAAPYSVNGVGMVFGFSLFVNIFLVSSVYVVLFTVYKGVMSEELRGAFIERLREGKVVVFLQLLFVSGFAVLQSSLVMSAAVFSALFGLVLLYHLSKELEDSVMSRSVSLDSVEVGDVIDAGGLDLGRSRERNLIGKLFNKLDNLTRGWFSGSFLSVVEERMGYSEIVGVTEEELKELESQGVEEVGVKEGLRLVPVFPVALVLSEVGLTVVTYFSFL